MLKVHCYAGYETPAWMLTYGFMRDQLYNLSLYLDEQIAYDN